MAVHSASRYAVAALCLVAAAAHLLVTPEHLQEARYVGLLFVVLEVVFVVLAALLVLWDSVVVWLAAAMAGAATLTGYAVSRTVGLPELGDDVGNWWEPLGVVCLVDELLIVGLAALAVRSGLVMHAPSAQASRVPGLALGLAVLLVGFVATGQAATAQSGSGLLGGHHHEGVGKRAYWSAVGGQSIPADGRTRTYVIGADEVQWDYAPDGHDDITGRPFDEVADVFVKPGPNRIGSRYLKCLYRGYTDATFSTLAPRPAEEAYLGLLGPVIRAEVGDTVRVVFRNTCSQPVSVHPHGVFYTKDSEGAPYSDGTSGSDKADDAVPPGGRHTYVWQVPRRAGPGPADGSSVMWMYHSHTDEVADTYAGLMGPIVVTRHGDARADGSPRDVDQEVFALFAVMDENQSFYLDDNHENAEPLAEGQDEEADEEAFAESNLMHSVNGYVYGNMPMVTVHKGSRVRWYVMSMGTEVDLHTPHWHGNVVTVHGMRMDVVDLLPAGMVVADMVPDDAGTWLLHCHVNDHILAGMTARYRVV